MKNGGHEQIRFKIYREYGIESSFKNLVRVNDERGKEAVVVADEGGLNCGTACVQKRQIHHLSIEAKPTVGL